MGPHLNLWDLGALKPRPRGSSRPHGGRGQWERSEKRIHVSHTHGRTAGGAVGAQLRGLLWLHPRPRANRTTCIFCALATEQGHRPGYISVSLYSLLGSLKCPGKPRGLRLRTLQNALFIAFLQEQSAFQKMLLAQGYKIGVKKANFQLISESQLFPHKCCV